MLWRSFFTGNLPLDKALFFVFYPITIICIALIYYKYPFYFEFITKPVNHGKVNGVFVTVLWLICFFVGVLTLVNAEKSKNVYLKYLTYISIIIVFLYPIRSLFFTIILIIISPFIEPFS
jgi:hypothetical protein